VRGTQDVSERSLHQKRTQDTIAAGASTTPRRLEERNLAAALGDGEADESPAGSQEENLLEFLRNPCVTAGNDV
jgi:hypothetical protein